MIGHLTLGKGSKVGAQSGIAKDLPPGSFVRGSPAQPYMTEQRLEALRRRLPDLFKRVADLEQKTGSAKEG
jgi:UDP-3-O-[3-hydroxymyristoyl] glucosamine N-acyltransferase